MHQLPFECYSSNYNKSGVLGYTGTSVLITLPCYSDKSQDKVGFEKLVWTSF